MTYSLEQIADGQRMTQVLARLQADLDALRHMLTVYEDAVTMPGRRPDVDADGTGRRGTSGPSRPTERTALDHDRVALQQQLKTGADHIVYATAYVRGVTASMDRALSRWEGEG